ncbi:hypothetical protein B1756_09210 [Natrarchaeobaculum aegyptiacum]|uniref:TM2 domain-containing protein n=1 Tax=Natrarchaeobaculum aegyptiacum TaxID=745377 RepID=A0A2Z2HWY7_9EURY|nr:hypothetical protein B1756_09210 [Natrarchaeobaculum aegyptiacum]
MVSAILSFFIPGVGNLYNGEMQRGAIVLVAWLVIGVGFWWFFVPIVGTLTLGLGFLLYLLWPFVHIAAAYDGYNQANKINSGEITV